MVMLNNQRVTFSLKIAMGYAFGDHFHHVRCVYTPCGPSRLSSPQILCRNTPAGRLAEIWTALQMGFVASDLVAGLSERKLVLPFSEGSWSW